MKLSGIGGDQDPLGVELLELIPLEVGAVSTLTAAFGTFSRRDFSEFPQIQASNGSFDVCDNNPTNDPPNFCIN